MFVLFKKGVIDNFYKGPIKANARFYHFPLA